MKIKPYLNRLNDSKEFKDFRKKHKDSFAMAGFFVLDFESGKNMHQIDYYVPSIKKVAAFSLDNGIVLQMLDGSTGKTPEELDMNTRIDLGALQGILEDEMKNRGITEEIKKIIAVLQNLDGKKIWNLNCVLSGMSLLKANVEDETESVLKMEKSSIFDFIKKIPAAQLKAQLSGNKDAEQKGTDPKAVQEELNKKLQNLDKLKEQIEKEETELKKQVEDSSKPKVAKAKKSKK